MTEDTEWLKKNPRMNLWRSSRFYGQDLDTSVMAHDQKSKNDILVVSHIPKRSNIPIEKIKQMDFKFPAPVSKKTGMSKFVVPLVSVSRPSMHLRPRENETEIQKQGVVKPNGRPSVLNKGSQPSANLSNLSTAKSKMVQSTPMITGKRNPNSVVSSADLSLLSRSKVVNQSTPNETAILRSILKQNQSSGRMCVRNLSTRKKPTAAKRVNFNGSVKDKCQEKVNEESGKGAFPTIDTEKGTVAHPSRQNTEKELLTESGEESTEAFSNSFKPLPDEEVESSNEKGGNVQNVSDKVNECSGEEMEVKNSVVAHNENSESSDPGIFINGIMDMWKVHHSRISDIRNELQLIDENFHMTLKSVMNSEIEEKLSVYEGEKAKLYEKLRELEIEFREKVKSCTQVKTLFLSYIDRKKNILRAQFQLEENFEKALHTILEKYMQEPSFGMGNDEDDSEPSGTASRKIKRGKRVSGVKRKCCCVSGIKARATPPKRSSMGIKGSSGSTPDNTPARRRKLSRKIEKQIRNLFEE